MINIICVGKIKEKYLIDLIDDYKKRVSKYTKINIIEIPDNEKMSIETEKIHHYINSKHYNIALCIEGNKIDSPNLAKLIDKTLINYSDITFIIGGSNGLETSIKSKCNYLLSFSDMTFPHGLFRGILLEQIYRSYKINNNETYHK